MATDRDHREEDQSRHHRDEACQASVPRQSEAADPEADPPLPAGSRLGLVPTAASALPRATGSVAAAATAPAVAAVRSPEVWGTCWDPTDGSRLDFASCQPPLNWFSRASRADMTPAPWPCPPARCPSCAMISAMVLSPAMSPPALYPPARLPPPPPFAPACCACSPRHCQPLPPFAAPLRMSGVPTPGMSIESFPIWRVPGYAFR